MEGMVGMVRRHWFPSFIVAILLCQLAGVLGVLFTSAAIPGWYAQLNQPALNPPSWVFSPVWVSLYTLMGIAAALVWKAGWQQSGVRVALGLFAVQLALNAAWSLLFFGLRNPLFGLIDIIFMLAAIVATVIAFARVSRPAALLLLPYLLWVSFATYLNAAIWLLNP